MVLSEFKPFWLTVKQGLSDLSPFGDEKIDLSPFGKPPATVFIPEIAIFGQFRDNFAIFLTHYELSSKPTINDFQLDMWDEMTFNLVQKWLKPFLQ